MLLHFFTRAAARPVHALMLAFSVIVVVAAFLIGYRLLPGSADQVLAYQIVITGGQIATLLFVAVYTKLARWWNNPVGRTIVSLDLALFVALIPVTLSLFFHLNRLTAEIGSALDLAAFTAIPIIMLWRIYVWVQLRRAGQPVDS